MVLGRVVGSHGLRGGLRVRTFGDDPGLLARLRHVALGASADDSEAGVYEVASAHPVRHGQLRLALVGVRERGAAEALQGRLVLCEPEALPELPEGEYYWFQLVGCRVEGHEGSPIGTVRELWDTGAHDVLVVERGDAPPALIPTARELLREVDLARRRIVIELIPGLVDLPGGAGAAGQGPESEGGAACSGSTSSPSSRTSSNPGGASPPSGSRAGRAWRK